MDKLTVDHWATSIALELCKHCEGDIDKLRLNALELCAAICTHVRDAAEGIEGAAKDQEEALCETTTH